MKFIFQEIRYSYCYDIYGGIMKSVHYSQTSA